MRKGPTGCVPLLICLALIPSAARLAFGQELEPRAYRTLPIDLNFVAVSYQYMTGNVVADATLPIADLEADIQTATISYLRTLGLFGRSASVAFSAPYVYMTASTTIDGERLAGSRGGWADARARLTVNLLGGPALSLSEWARFRQGRTLGVSLTVAAPTGQYNSANLINFGTHRWGFKPELGYSSVRGRWIFDVAAGVWFFTANTDGFGGTTMRQDPVSSVQGHVSYNFPGGVWLALDGNYFRGGESSIDGEDTGDLQENSRIGLTLSIPLRKRQSLKLQAQTGAFTRLGADFDVATVTYQCQWGGTSRRKLSGRARAEFRAPQVH